MNTPSPCQEARAEARIGKDISPSLLFILAYTAAFLGSKFLGLAVGYALDDYAVSNAAAQKGLADLFISQGRYTTAALDAVLKASHLNMTNFSVIGFIATLAFSGLFYLTVFAPDKNPYKPSILVACAALLGSHSYYTEYITFRQAALPMAVVYAMLYIGAVQYQRSISQKNRQWRSLALAFVAGLVMMGVNQLAVCFASIAILYMHLSDTGCTFNRESGATKAPLVAMSASGLAGIALIGGSSAISALARLTNHASASSRAAILSADQIPERGKQLMELLPKLMISQEPIASTPAKLLLVGALLVLIVPTTRRQSENSATAIFFATLGLVIALIPAIFPAVWWPVPRTLIAIPFVFAGAIALAARNKKRFANLGAGLAIASAILFCAHSTAVLQNQFRLNRWDMSQAQEIASRVAERFPSNAGKIAIVGGSWSHPLEPGIAQGDMNISAMGVDWAIDSLFDEATGRDLSVRAAPEFAAECSVLAHSASAEPMVQKGDEVVVCL